MERLCGTVSWFENLKFLEGFYVATSSDIHVGRSVCCYGGLSKAILHLIRWATERQ